MKLTIKNRMVDGVKEVLLQVDRARQDPAWVMEVTFECLQSLGEYLKGGQVANEVLPDGSERLSAILAGPFSMSVVRYWVAELAYEVYQGAPRLDVPGRKGYPFEYEYQDQPYANKEALIAAIMDEPDTAFELGTFTLTGAVMRTTDPSYSRVLWNKGLFAAVSGVWYATTVLGMTTDAGMRVKQLRIRHESAPADVFETLEAFQPITEWKASVDAGQCGFFDEAQYPYEPYEFGYEGDTFFRRCAELVLDRQRPGGGIIREGYGVTSSSGYGDGGYQVRVLKNNEGQAVAAFIKFIKKPEDNE